MTSWAYPYESKLHPQKRKAMRMNNKQDAYQTKCASINKRKVWKHKLLASHQQSVANLDTTQTYQPYDTAINYQSILQVILVSYIVTFKIMLFLKESGAGLTPYRLKAHRLGCEQLYPD